MIEKVYIQLKLITESPFAVCSGLDEYSDKDIIRHVRNNSEDSKPYIPGSTLAGAFRDYIEGIEEYTSKEKGKGINDKFFGYIERGNTKEEHRARQSKIFFGDAELIEKFNTSHICDKSSNTQALEDENYIISLRDGVKLDNRKTAEYSGKYNYEIIEPNTVFASIIEYSGKDKDIFKEIIESIVSAINSSEIRIGSKTNRGLGVMKAEYRIKSFSNKNVSEWLKFDPYAYEWDKLTKGSENTNVQFSGFSVNVKIPHTIIIRDYNAEPTAILGEKKYNFENLNCGQLKSNGSAVIPGTTWAGAFRHRAEMILNELVEGLKAENDSKFDEAKLKKFIDKAFGCAIATKSNRENETKESILSFFESKITGGTIIPLTRTKIDRFTGGAMSKALFSEVVYCGGNTELRIGINKKCIKAYDKEKGSDEKLDWQKNSTFKAILGMIVLIMDDLKEGLLAIGGETAVGRGIVEANEYDLPCNLKRDDCLKSLTKELGI